MSPEGIQILERRSGSPAILCHVEKVLSPSNTVRNFPCSQILTRLLPASADAVAYLEG